MLREEFAKGRPADVPDAPTHASLLAAKAAGQEKRDDQVEEGARA
ncbi:LLM class flavin-dependent oxidoreductase [Streptomyces violaceorubidus]